MKRRLILWFKMLIFATVWFLILWPRFYFGLEKQQQQKHYVFQQVSTGRMGVITITTSTEKKRNE